MPSQMLYTNGSFEICQERMFVKQRRKHGWSSYFPDGNLLRFIFEYCWIALTYIWVLLVSGHWYILQII